MAGLLAPEGVAVLLHLLQHIPVTDRGLHQPDPLPLHRELEPEVGHHRRDHRVGPQRGPLPQRQRQHREDLVAVDLLTGVVHGQAPVGVPVVRDPQRGPVLDDRGLQPVEVRRTAPVVDVEPVRLGTDRDHFRPGPGERLRRHLRRGTVRLVEDDPQTVQPVREHADEVVDVRVQPLPEVPHAAHARAGRPVPGRPGAVLLVHGLDAVLQLVGELVTAAGEELDAVVRHGVVAGGEHHTEVGAERPGEMGHRRRRQHTDAQHVHARAREPRDDGRLQELPGGTRITPDHRGGPMPFERARLGQHVRRGHGQAERHLRRQVRVGDTAHAVRAEESSHLSS